MTPSTAATAGSARADLLTRLSHELRTPLNSVIGFSGVMQRNRIGNQQPRDIAMLRAIRANGERLLGLVEDLVAISVASSTSTDATTSWTCVADVAEMCVKKWKDAADAKGIDLRLVVQSGDLVRIDATILGRILCKLVGNALKFSTSGCVTVTVARAANAGPGSIVVADNGIGIAAHQLESIFEPFSQADSGASRSYEGAGLGLSVARSLAESLHCRLSVESTLGKGTTFTVKLPD